MERREGARRWTCQFSLPADRFFFAIFPDASAAERIAHEASRLRAENGLRGKPLEPERFHISLHHLGDHCDVRRDVIAAARDAAANLRFAPFELAFERAESFIGRRNNMPLVLGGTERVGNVRTLQRSLGDEMRLAGLGRWVEGSFTPHLTLLYDDRAVAAQAIEPITWMCREIVLVHSVMGKHRNIVLGRWPLAA